MYKRNNTSLLEVPTREGRESSIDITEKIDPLKYQTDIKEERGNLDVYCGCPCPKVSAPIWAAGVVTFNPLD